MVGVRRVLSVGLRLVRVPAVVVLLAALAVAVGHPQPAAAAVPGGFSEVTTFSGLTQPTAVRFAPDGRIFVAEKRGTIKMFRSLTDTSPVIVADLQTEVYDFW